MAGISRKLEWWSGRIWPITAVDIEEDHLPDIIAELDVGEL